MSALVLAMLRFIRGLQRCPAWPSCPLAALQVMCNTGSSAATTPQMEQGRPPQQQAVPIGHLPASVAEALAPVLDATQVSVRVFLMQGPAGGAGSKSNPGSRAASPERAGTPAQGLASALATPAVAALAAVVAATPAATTVTSAEDQGGQSTPDCTPSQHSPKPKPEAVHQSSPFATAAAQRAQLDCDNGDVECAAAVKEETGEPCMREQQQQQQVNLNGQPLAAMCSLGRSHSDGCGPGAGAHAEGHRPLIRRASSSGNAPASRLTSRGSGGPASAGLVLLVRPHPTVPGHERPAMLAKLRQAVEAADALRAGQETGRILREKFGLMVEQLRWAGQGGLLDQGMYTWGG